MYEMVAWQHPFNGHEFQQTPGDSEGQGSLACCSPWGRKELDTTERLSLLRTFLMAQLVKNPPAMQETPV